MLRAETPYFMTNKEWFYYDNNLSKYVLTNKAPKKAIDSYNKWYEEFLIQYDIEDSRKENSKDG